MTSRERHLASMCHIPMPIEPLCTKKVMVMEAVQGEPLKKKMKNLLAESAAKAGYDGSSEAKSVDAYVKKLQDEYERNPSKLQNEMYNKSGFGSTNFFFEPAKLFDIYAHFRTSVDVICNVPRFCGNLVIDDLLLRSLRCAWWPFSFLFAGGSGSSDVPRKRLFPYKWSAEVVNSPRIVQILFDVHAQQIFRDGLFNSDPHCGNVLVKSQNSSSKKLSSSSGEDALVGLVDYGAVAELTDAEQISFAKLIVAVAEMADYYEKHPAKPVPVDTKNIGSTENVKLNPVDQQVVDAFIACGGHSKKNDPTFLLGNALVCFHRGWAPADWARLGIPDDPVEWDTHMNAIDKWEKFPKHLLVLQRCAGVLLAVAVETGAGSVSLAKLWEAAARQRLQEPGC